MNRRASVETSPLEPRFNYGAVWGQFIALGRPVRLQPSQSLDPQIQSETALILLIRGKLVLAAQCSKTANERVLLERSAPAVIILPLEIRGRWAVSVTAAALTEIVSCRSSEVDASFTARGSLGSSFGRLLLTEIEKLTFALAARTTSDAEDRVRALLIEACEDANGEVRLTQEQIAARAGISRQWVNRILVNLERDGALRRQRGRIIIENLGLCSESFRRASAMKLYAEKYPAPGGGGQCERNPEFRSAAEVGKGSPNADGAQTRQGRAACGQNGQC